MKKTKKKVTKYCFLFCFFTYAVEPPKTCKHTFVCKTGGVIRVRLVTGTARCPHEALLCLPKRPSTICRVRLLAALLSSLPQQHAANLLPVRLSSTLRTHALLCLQHLAVVNLLCRQTSRRTSYLHSYLTPT